LFAKEAKRIDANAREMKSKWQLIVWAPPPSCKENETKKLF
jgi:hypothetical protein